jgi:nucleolar protein 56
MVAATRGALFISRGLGSARRRSGVSRSVVSTWFGTFLVEDDRVVRSVIPPMEVTALAARARRRQSGGLTPEEEELLATRAEEAWSTRDRRLADHGLRWEPAAPVAPTSSAGDGEHGHHRLALLEAAEEALRSAWDPSVHVEEAVRAAADLDRVRNLVGERLAAWVGHDAPDLDPGDPATAARRALEDATDPALGPADPAIREARRRLADLYRAIDVTRGEIGRAVDAAMPGRTPNLTALLGPELAARLLAQARGLDRLARMPASTVQVLGAERAFFEHLRGRAPPPRHGLLFLHPAVQGAPRRERGKLARALAGKVAIAARLDRSGAEVDPALARAFEARRAQLKQRRGDAPGRERRPRSRKPFHAATRHR